MPGRRTQNLNHVTEGRKWQNFDLHFLWFLMWQLREDLRRFLWFLNCSFILCTSLYAVLAIAGFTMFGEDTASQITLNLPKQFFASKLATWTTVSNHLGSNLWYVVDNHLVLWASYGCRVLQFHEPKLFLDIRYLNPKPLTFSIYHRYVYLCYADRELIWWKLCRWSTLSPNILSKFLNTADVFGWDFHHCVLC